MRIILFVLIAVLGLSLFAGLAVSAGTETSETGRQRLFSSEEFKEKGFWESVRDRKSEIFQKAREHIRLTVLAMALAIGIGVTGGIVLTRFKRGAYAVLAAASIIQTIPSLALLALMLPYLGTGLKPSVAALFLYALLPILRNTYIAIDEVDDTMIEVGRGMGMTSAQILLKVEIPLCVPVVMAGVRTSTVICVGIATLCSLIGAGGLGDLIIEGLQKKGNTVIFIGVVPAILLALALDGIMAMLQKAFTPKGLKLAE